MKNFREIVGSIGVDRLPNNHAELRDNVEVQFNPGGGGYTASLVFEDSTVGSFHITVYENSWDGTININDYGGEQVSIGPFCLHVTATNTNERWYFQYVQDSWMFVTDYGEPSQKALKAFQFLFSKIGRFFMSE
ncbi:MAG TPA: hypothetical protein VIF37_10205 [Methylobacter sp.]|jgi:hypothetical protein